MTAKGPKTGIVLTFVMMLVLAMCLQSLVVLFLGVRAAVKEDVAWASRTLQSLAILSAYMGDGNVQTPELMTIYEGLQENHSQTFSCLNVELAGLSTGLTPCLFPDELLEKARQAKATNKLTLDFAGSNWNVFLIRSDAIHLALPLKNRKGQTIGTISAERSLVPIYSRYERQTWLAIAYLVVNAAIFSGLGFFRMERILFKPLDRLVQKAENYRPDQQELFLVSDDGSAFRKLSMSFNSLLDRIERDNHILRQTVTKLEALNKELKEKNDLVVRSEKLASVGRLSAGLAHEIGNPLSIIQGYVELLGREDLADDEKMQFSSKAQQELDRIKKLIRQLLDFAGSMQSEAGPMSVNALIHDVIDFVSMEKTFAGCTILTELNADQDEIVGEKDVLRQVLINCLLNAADATAGNQNNTRQIVITTSVEKCSAMGRHLVISIMDNGLGIDEAHLGNIFDPFFTTKEVGLGTGLGLFVCHTIMERLGGTITLRNRTPCGIEVKLQIPLQRTLPT